METNKKFEKIKLFGFHTGERRKKVLLVRSCGGKNSSKKRGWKLCSMRGTGKRGNLFKKM